MIAYVSRTGKTEKMAEYIAEGVRFSGSEAVVKKISDIKDEKICLKCKKTDIIKLDYKGYK